MLEKRKPRHIRDIAHLYISRSQHRPQVPVATVVITGEDRGCFPGFHVANLAAALSIKNCPIHLFEQSGLLPNAGYFLSLPPRQYIRWKDDGEGRAAGLGGVEIDCAAKGSRVPSRGSRVPRVELLHLPPLSEEDRFENALRELEDRESPVTVFVVLRTGRPPRPGLPRSVAETLKPSIACVLRLGEPAGGGADEPEGYTTGHPAGGRENDPVSRRKDQPARHGEGEPALIDLGGIADWECAVDDRVPAVIRDPGSALSAGYRSASEALLFKINKLGRSSDAIRVSGISAGIGYGPRHR